MTEERENEKACVGLGAKRELTHAPRADHNRKVGQMVLPYLPGRPLCSLGSLTAPVDGPVVPKMLLCFESPGILKKKKRIPKPGVHSLDVLI